ncbi:EAL domain-containing protein [Ornithinibacillus halotolerans]|uniref:GGDEF domain-containing protein n=1 Tax=Ornithinibacillus halotolerans TaxID=1274357 RepID=A0A916RVK8_9BACI|nr:EAL domain-containing protein [Ornithinibacillus halotolerans]GGA71296.1 GGDEF domain-containing protein [Ornithinibacillus halotolerans]
MFELIELLKTEQYSIINILEKLVDFICVKDGEGKWIQVNLLSGHDITLNELYNIEVQGKKDEELEQLYPELSWFFENSRELDERTWAIGEITKFEEQLIDNDGKLYVFEVIKIPFFNEDGTRKELVVLGKDITVNKTNELQMIQNNKELEQLKFAINESAIVAITEKSGMITYVNDMFCEVSKYSKEELIGKTHRVINSGFHPKTFFRDMWKTIQSGQVWRGNIKNKTKDGKYYWVSSTIVPFLDDNGEPYQYISIRHDITEQKRIEEKIRYHSYHDQLTGLRNRWYLNEEINNWLEKHSENHRMAVLFMDINRFKTINDTLGHTVGDMIIKSVAKRFLNYLPDEVELYRFGGDEFIFVMKNCTIDEIEDLTNMINRLLANPFLAKGEKVYLTASIGISLYPKDGNDLDTLVRKADSAMYVAKNNHIKGAQYYSSEKYEEIKKRALLEKELRIAIRENNFHLLYQPQYDLKTNRIVGVEALIRWEHQSLGIISPADFIPLAEEIGVISQLTEWVLAEACRQAVEWQQQGLPPIQIGINISPFLLGEEIITLVEETLHNTGLDAQFVDLEITESFMQDPEYAINILNRLKNIGVKLSIDDFGTGYSSLSYLGRLPMDNLKIDRSFIDGIKADNGMMVKTILDMANHLHVSVIAEGIETKEQLQFLRRFQCQIGQGYYFSRPVSSEEIKALFH